MTRRKPERPDGVSARRSRTAPIAGKARPPRGISVMLVDDHPMWRATVRDVLADARAGTVVAEASDGTEVVDLATEVEPDVVVMDIGLPSLGGAEATRRLLAECPQVKVLVLSASSDKDDVLDAVEAGATGYLLKTAGPDHVVDAVRRVHRGEMVLPPELSAAVLRDIRARPGEPAGRVGYSVAVGDPSMLIRKGLAHVLTEAGFEVLGTAEDVEGLDDLVATVTPDVVVLDIGFGSRVVAKFRTDHPQTGVVVMSEKPDSRALELLTGGTEGLGYLLKDRVSDPSEVGEMIRRVARGESAVDAGVVAELLASERDRKAFADLTDREQEVLAMMAEGLSNQAIRERLYVTPKTVETHVRNIFMKLGLEPTVDDHRRVMAVLAYLRSL